MNGEALRENKNIRRKKKVNLLYKTSTCGLTKGLTNVMELPAAEVMFSRGNDLPMANGS